MLAWMLAGSSIHGCCDPAVATDGTVAIESSASEDGSTGESALPQWAIGIFSSETDQVGMSFSDNPYWWNNLEITADGGLFYDLFGCSGLIERQEFHWTLGEDRQSLRVEPIPGTEVFEWANGNQVSEVVVEPGDTCDTIVIRYHAIDPMVWVASEQRRGEVCARPTDSDGCTFTFEWCDGEPPPPCE